MNKDQANQLKEGDIVYHKLDNVKGKVVSFNPGVCLNIEWDDGVKGSLHPADMATMEKYEPGIEDKDEGKEAADRLDRAVVAVACAAQEVVCFATRDGDDQYVIEAEVMDELIASTKEWKAATQAFLLQLNKE
jgi:hypothetical protein